MNTLPAPSPTAMTPLLRDKLLAITPKMQGWCTPEKVIDLAQSVLDYKPQLVVELGVFGARSLIPIAMAMQHNGSGMVYGIDTWSNAVAVEHFDQNNEDDRRQISWWNSIKMGEILSGAMKVLDDHWLTDYAALIRARSELVVDRFAPESIDMLHIDGDHTELSSCRDVDQWLPRVKTKGWIWIDDTDWPQLQKALRLIESRKAVMVKDEVKYRLYQKR